MRVILRWVGGGLLVIGGLSFIWMLIVFPMVGTESGSYRLYALRRPVAVTRDEYALVMGLLGTGVLGSILGGVLWAIGGRGRD